MRGSRTIFPLVLVGIVAISGLLWRSFHRNQYETHEPSESGTLDRAVLIRLDESAPGYWKLKFHSRFRGMDSARRQAERLALQYPSSAASHHNLGAFLFLTDRKRAISEFNRASQLDPAYKLSREALSKLEEFDRR